MPVDSLQLSSLTALWPATTVWPINKTVAGKAGVFLSARPRPLLLHLLDLTLGLPRTRQTNNSWGSSVTECNAVTAGTGCAGQSKPSDPVNSHCHQHSISANDAERVPPKIQL